jgi:hypothetical protein
VTVRAENVSFDFGTSMLSASNGHGTFVLMDSGMAGEGEITVSVSAFGGSFSYPFTWAFNNMPSAVEESVSTGPGPNTTVTAAMVARAQVRPAAPPSLTEALEALDIPSGPFNRLSLDARDYPAVFPGGVIQFSVNVAGHTQSIEVVSLVLEMVEADAPDSDYVTVGVSGFGMTLGGGAIRLEVEDGTGALVIYDSGVAGEIRVGSVNLAGPGAATADASVTATNLEVRFNNTGGPVGPVTVSVSEDESEDVVIEFPNDSDYFNYLAVSGTAEIGLTLGVVNITLGGNFAFQVLGSDELQIGAE